MSELLNTQMRCVNHIEHERDSRFKDELLDKLCRTSSRSMLASLLYRSSMLAGNDGFTACFTTR